MYPGELKKKVSKGELSPVYFFYGENIHLVEEAITDIRLFLFPSGKSDFDLNFFDAREHGFPEIMQPVRTLPFLSEKRLVVVKSAQAFNESHWKSFSKYFAKPSNSCCLVFVLLIDGKSPKEKKLLNFINQHGAVVSFANPRGNQVKSFIKSGLSTYGKKIDPDALNYLTDNTDCNALTINNELKKIVLFCREKKTVSVRDVENVLSCGHNNTIFELLDAIGHGSIEKSQVILNNLLSDGVYPLVVLKMIARQIRHISIAWQVVKSGGKTADVGKSLHMGYDRIINSIIQQSRGWSADSLRNAFTAIMQSDFLLKSSRIDKKIVLEDLVFRLASLKTQLPA